MKAGARLQFPAGELAALQHRSIAIEGQQDQPRLGDALDQQRPHPFTAAGAGAGHQPGGSDPERPRGLPRLHQLQRTPEIGPVPHQQGPPRHRAEAAEVAAAGQDLTARLPRRQGAQRQPLPLRHDQFTTTGQHRHRAAGLNLKAPPAAAAEPLHQPFRPLGQRGGLHQQIALPVAAQLGVLERFAHEAIDALLLHPAQIGPQRRVDGGHLLQVAFLQVEAPHLVTPLVIPAHHSHTGAIAQRLEL